MDDGLQVRETGNREMGEKVTAVAQELKSKAK